MRFFSIILAAVCFIQQASARQARCFTTEDGHYNCELNDDISQDEKGAFEIYGADKPAITIVLKKQPNTAAVHVRYGTNRRYALPGTYTRSRKDPACWENKPRNLKVCAW